MTEQQTKNLKNLANDVLNHLKTRHGSVLHIAEQEYELLKNSTFK
jgi:hypothetical protein